MSLGKRNATARRSRIDRKHIPFRLPIFDFPFPFRSYGSRFDWRRQRREPAISSKDARQFDLLRKYYALPMRSACFFLPFVFLRLALPASSPMTQSSRLFENLIHRIRFQELNLFSISWFVRKSAPKEKTLNERMRRQINEKVLFDFFFSHTYCFGDDVIGCRRFWWTTGYHVLPT